MCLVFAMRPGKGGKRAEDIAGPRRGGKRRCFPQRLHGRARCAREGSGGMTLGGGTHHRRGLARFAGVRSLRVASCDAEHVAVRRAYVRHDYAFTPLPLPLYLVPDCSRLLSFSISLLTTFAHPHSRVHLLFARFHFVSPPRPRRLLRTSFLSIRASDFSALSAVPKTFPITRLLIAIRFPKDLRKFVGGSTYLETNVFGTQYFSNNAHWRITNMNLLVDKFIQQHLLTIRPIFLIMRRFCEEF